MGQLDPQRAQQQLVVGAFQGEAEAELAATMLAARGISAAVSFGDVDAAFPSLSFVRGFRVIVDAEHAEEARLLLNPPEDPDRRAGEPPAPEGGLAPDPGQPPAAGASPADPPAPA